MFRKWPPHLVSEIGEPRNSRNAALVSALVGSTKVLEPVQHRNIISVFLVEDDIGSRHTPNSTLSQYWYAFRRKVRSGGSRHGRFAEVVNAGKAEERQFEEWDDGTWLECEAVSLTRDLANHSLSRGHERLMATRKAARRAEARRAARSVYRAATCATPA